MPINIRRNINTYIISSSSMISIRISSSVYSSTRISTTLDMNMIVRIRGNISLHSNINTKNNVIFVFIVLYNPFFQ